jgi:hypothetical protein
MELEALGPDARRRVIRAVRKGTMVEDPEEAAAAVTLAREVQAVPPDERALRLRLLLPGQRRRERAARAERLNLRVAGQRD